MNLFFRPSTNRPAGTLCEQNDLTTANTCEVNCRTKKPLLGSGMNGGIENDGKKNSESGSDWRRCLVRRRLQCDNEEQKGGVGDLFRCDT
jgi:hypothetical protein